MKLLIIAGARPNFMKVGPLIKALRACSTTRSKDRIKLEWRLIHTGQHYDDRMSAIFFEELGIPEPDENLEVGSGSHASQTAAIMTRFEGTCLRERPDWVVVVGDVNSTLACTLVAAKLGIRVAHIEAGLRSFDRTMPEEINRLVTDAVADLLLTPSDDGNENLLREGVAPEKIRLVGNIMIDALIANLDQARHSILPHRLGLSNGNFAYVTLHRPANVDGEHSLDIIMDQLKRLSKELPVVFPMHPRTRKMCGQFGISLKGNNGLHIIDPIGYHDSLFLTEKARLVLTDSGGLQEESTWFRTPCLTLRPNTERPITITMGSNQLTNLDSLSLDLARVLGRESRLGQIPPLWDGQTSRRVLHELIGNF